RARRTDQQAQLSASLRQSASDVAADKSSSSGDEDFHGSLSRAKRGIPFVARVLLSSSSAFDELLKGFPIQSEAALESPDQGLCPPYVAQTAPMNPSPYLSYESELVHVVFSREVTSNRRSPISYGS